MITVVNTKNDHPLKRIGFWYDRPVEYSGGLNYLRNLLYALSLVNDREVQACVFFGCDINPSIVAGFSPYATVIHTPILDRNSAPWFLHKIALRCLGSMAVVNRLLERHGIDIVSHSEYIHGDNLPFKLIRWIPDLQYLHLPALFPGLTPDLESKRIRKLVEQSDAVILSSHSALNDLKTIIPTNYLPRCGVVQFVSQPIRTTRATSNGDELISVKTKYRITGKYFILPNQFWAHKNHITVFEAIKILRDEGLDVLVVCTGNLIDYRLKGTKYVDSLRTYIQSNSLDDNIRILGNIDYDDVLTLIKNAVAVLNPSRFEGWSSTVEEAKSIGKMAILSNIDVHLEQNPQFCIYFPLNDVVALSKILSETWSRSDGSPNHDIEIEAADALRQRTLAFGNAYLNIVRAVLNDVPVLTGGQPMVRDCTT